MNVVGNARPDLADARNASGRSDAGKVFERTIFLNAARAAWT